MTASENQHEVVLTIGLSPEDSERLLAALRDGRLAELGIVGVRILPDSQGTMTTETCPAATGKWTQAEVAYRSATNDLPPSRRS